MDQARLTFENAFRAWLNKRSKRFLLAGADLKNVVRNLDQFSGGTVSGERATFLKLSLRRRLWHRLITAGVLLGLTALVGFSWGKYQVFEAKRDLVQAGLPGDLYDYQFQILDLTLTAPISNLDWLHTSRLERLHVSSAALRDLNDIPTSLVQLEVPKCQILTLAPLEKLGNLTMLDLSRNPLRSLEGLEKLKKLTTLVLNNAAGDYSEDRLFNLAGLEKLETLTTLTLGGTGLFNLDRLEKLSNLTTLNLIDEPLLSLDGLEKLHKLTTLTLRKIGLAGTMLEETWYKFPNSITKLTELTTLSMNQLKLLTNEPNVAWIEKLDTLTTLDLSSTQFQNLRALEKLDKLTTLNLSELKINIKGSAFHVPVLETLETLAKLTTLNLSTLSVDISGSSDPDALSAFHVVVLETLQKLDKLTTLDFSLNALKSLAGLEKLGKLTTLSLSGNPSEVWRN